EETRTLTTPYGRQIQFHDHINEKLYREATAWVPQSTSVDYLNRGFLRVYHEFQKRGAWGLKILAQTHDSIMFMYKQNHRDEAIPSVMNAIGDQTIRIKGREFSIPTEASYGHSWGGMKEYEKAA